MSPAGTDEQVVVGYVVKAHGIKGELRVRTDSDALLDAQRVFVAGAKKVRGVRRDRDDLLLLLEGVDDRNAAEALRGQSVSLLRGELPPIADDEVYVADLIGCQLFDAGGVRLGEVVGTFFGGAHELLEVKGERGEFMLPFVDGIVLSVDVAGRRVVCDPPEGLMELDGPADEP